MRNGEVQLCVDIEFLMEIDSFPEHQLIDCCGFEKIPPTESG